SDLKYHSLNHLATVGKMCCSFSLSLRLECDSELLIGTNRFAIIPEQLLFLFFAPNLSFFLSRFIFIPKHFYLRPFYYTEINLPPVYASYLRTYMVLIA